MKLTCQCASRGFCSRRNAYVPNYQWKQCQAGQVDHVDEVIERLQYRGTGPENASHPIVYTVEYNHWIPLHTYAPKNSLLWDAAKAKQWYRAWKRRIPSNGCGCQQKWKELGLQPDYSTAIAFFEWTVHAHNIVNVRLGKPIVNLLQSHLIWWPLATECI